MSKGYQNAKVVAASRRQFIDDILQLKAVGWRLCRQPGGNVGIDCSPARTLSVDARKKGQMAVVIVGYVIYVQISFYSKKLICKL